MEYLVETKQKIIYQLDFEKCLNDNLFNNYVIRKRTIIVAKVNIIYI